MGSRWSATYEYVPKPIPLLQRGTVRRAAAILYDGTHTKRALVAGVKMQRGRPGLPSGGIVRRYLSMPALR